MTIQVNYQPSEDKIKVHYFVVITRGWFHGFITAKEQMEVGKNEYIIRKMIDNDGC